MREVYCEFLIREYLPDGRVRVLIGAAGDAEGLEDLEDGEVILLRCSDLEAEAVAESEPWMETLYWSGVLASEDLIRRRKRGPRAADA